MNLNPQWIWIAVAAAAVVVIALIAIGVRRKRSADLREHFGSEYDRAVRAKGSRTAAEQELVSRAEEVKAYDIRPLSVRERNRYRDEWSQVEQRFVDRPATAVVEADELIAEVMRTRGYPVGDFEKHTAALSVDYPKVVEHYREGHTIIDRQGRGEASTEDLRQAVLHYRALFEELVGTSPRTDMESEIHTEREIAASEKPREVVRRDVEVEEERPNR